MDNKVLKDLGFTEVADTELADLGFTEVADDGDAVQTAKDFARAAAQSASFGTADELTGAGETALGVITGQTALQDILNAYKKSRDESRTAYEEAAVRSPIANIAGGIAGGVALGGGAGLATKALGQASKIGQLAKMLTTGETLAKDATVLRRGYEGGKTGLLAGGLAGVGGAEEISDIPGSIAQGATVGGLFGGGVGASVGALKKAVDLGKGIAKTETVEDLADAFKLGKENVNLLTREGREAAEDVISSEASKVGLGISQLRKDKGKVLGEIEELIDQSGYKFDKSQDIADAYAIANKLEATGTLEDVKAAKKLKEALDHYTTIQKTSTITEMSPEIVKKIPATKGKEAELLEEIEGLKFISKDKGEAAKYDLIKSEDGNWLSIRKTVDEPIGPRESLVKAPTETVATEQPFIKTAKQYGEISPLTRQKAQETLAKLQSKPENAGKLFEIIEDKNNGIINVVEKGTKKIEESIPGDISLVSDDVGFSTSSSYSRPTKNVLPTKEIEELIPGTATTKEITETVPRPMTDSLKEAKLLKAQLNELTQAPIGQTPLIGGSQQGLNLIKVLTGSLDEKMKKLSGLPKQLQEKYIKSSTEFNAVRQLFDELGMDLDNIQKLATGDVDLSRMFKDKLMSKIAAIETGGIGGVKARDLTKRVESLLGEAIGPEKAKETLEGMQKASRQFELAKKAAGVKPYKTSLLTSGGVLVGNVAGQAVRQIQEPLKAMSKSIATATPDQLKTYASKLMSKGGSGMKLAREMISLANKDNVGRQAALFSLRQDPNSRKLLDEVENEE